MKLAVTIPQDTVIVVDEELAGCFAEILAKATYHKWSGDKETYVEVVSRRPTIDLVREDEIDYIQTESNEG